MSAQDFSTQIAGLFDRPFEPYEPKFAIEAQGVQFISTRFTPVNLDEIEKLGRYANFSIFNREHMRLANKLMSFLLDAPDPSSFLQICTQAHDKVNPDLFTYAVSVAALHRKDTKNIPFTSHVQSFPHKYFNSNIFAPAIQKLHVAARNKQTDKCIIVEAPASASDLDIEHRIAYWREDPFINLHHWHWHLVYPFSSPPDHPEIVNKDRRGELFFYMHQQIQARYNFERFSNHLARVRSLSGYRDPIPEGYYPKLHNPMTGRDWVPRQAYSVMSDLKRENVKAKSEDGKNETNETMIIQLNHMEWWRDRIFSDIMDKLLFKTNGDKIKLDAKDVNGIDHLGNIIEASDLSDNPSRYGDLHNSGHLMIGYIHDPDYRYLEASSVIADNSVTMRDPCFYAWHAHIDDIFQEHKETLSPYTEEELKFNGITVKNIEVEIVGEKIKNEFHTFWQKVYINIEKGLNYQPSGICIYVRKTLLQHKPFTYHIEVENTGAARKGTVRIFMAPTKSESKEKFLFRQQRRLFIELDKFTYDLKSGTNKIDRLSTQSTVTIPLEQMLEGGTDNFCKCGWPHHLLIPKGNAEGLDAKLFVMITNAADDMVEKESVESACKSAPSYCGLQGQKYPDKKPMGFPFDRRARHNFLELEQFLTPNMHVTDVKIIYKNYIVTPDEPKPR